MTRLSFRGCWSLQSLEIGSQPNLEVLDLSDTMIKQFPSEMSTMEQLRCLYLSDIKIRGGPVHTSQFTYKHVYAQIKHVSMSSQNHLEISGGNNFPYGIGGALSAKESLHLHDNGFISRVSNMNIEKMNRLRFCLIERCCELESIVVGQSENVDALNSLESIQVFDLAKLKTICSGKLGRGSFQRLKHIHLHLCPNLVSCFSSITCLVQLESLEIEFCARLKVVFEGGEKDQIVFPSLKRIYIFFSYVVLGLGSSLYLYCVILDQGIIDVSFIISSMFNLHVFNLVTRHCPHLYLNFSLFYQSLNSFLSILVLIINE